MHGHMQRRLLLACCMCGHTQSYNASKQLWLSGQMPRGAMRDIAAGLWQQGLSVVSRQAASSCALAETGTEPT